MKARFDAKQPPVKIIENNNVVYVFICLNEEEKEEIVNYNENLENTEDSEQSNITIKYYEYDYNEFNDKKENVDTDDINTYPEKYLNYFPSKNENKEDKLQNEIDSLKTQLKELSSAIERGLTI